MANSSKLPPEWYYRRFQAVGLPQSRYLLLSVLVAAYTFGLSFTTRTTVSVSILVCRTSPRRSSTSVGMIVLDVLLLALFGTFQAAREAFAC